MSAPLSRCFGLTRRGSNQSKTKTTQLKIRQDGNAKLRMLKGDICEFSCDTFMLYNPATNDEQSERVSSIGVLVCALTISASVAGMFRVLGPIIHSQIERYPVCITTKANIDRAYSNNLERVNEYPICLTR